jgi:hypothetical protein
MFARVAFDDSYDDEVACRACILNEATDGSNDEVFMVNAAITRSAKRMLDSRAFDDSHAYKKMRSMNIKSATMDMTLQATTNVKERVQLVSEKHDMIDNYEGFMIGTYKKHTMAACFEELMQTVWHPCNYDRWRHLSHDD